MDQVLSYRWTGVTSDSAERWVKHYICNEWHVWMNLLLENASFMHDLHLNALFFRLGLFP